MAQKPKRILLSISEKIAIIESRENENISTRDLSKKYNCSQLQIQKVLKNKEEIKKLWRKFGPEYKRLRRSDKNSDINRIVHLWYQDARSQNLTISDSILKACARDVAKHLNKTSFRPTTVWVNRFHRQFDTKSEVDNEDNNNASQQDIIDYQKIANELNLKYEPAQNCEDFVKLENQSEDLNDSFAIEPEEEDIFKDMTFIKQEDNVWFTRSSESNNEKKYENINVKQNVDSVLNTPEYPPREPKMNINYNNLCFNNETIEDDFQEDNFKYEFNDFPSNEPSSQLNTDDPITAKSANNTYLSQINKSISSYSELLKHIYAIEDFAISQNDITLLKLSSVTRFIVEKKIEKQSSES